MRSTSLTALALAGALATAAPASAEILGATDLTAGTPTVACTGACTAVQQEPTAASPVVTASRDGVLVSVTVRHGGWTDPPGEIAVVPGMDVRIVSGSTSRAVTMSTIPRQGDGTDTFDGRGAAVKAGDRIGVSISRGGIPLFRAGSGGAAGAYFEGASTFSPVAGELLLQARVEPDADRDGLGDETQDPDAARDDVNVQPAFPKGMPDIELFRAEEITEYHAQPVEFFKAKEITPLPRTTSLEEAVLEGFSTPVRCPYACAYAAYTSILSIGQTLAGFRQAGEPRLVGTAKGELPGPGSARAHLRFDRRVARKLARVRKPVKVRVVYVLADHKGSTVRRQAIRLTPPRR